LAAKFAVLAMNPSFAAALQSGAVAQAMGDANFAAKAGYLNGRSAFGYASSAE
jgi:hypothetical protein